MENQIEQGPEADQIGTQAESVNVPQGSPVASTVKNTFLISTLAFACLVALSFFIFFFVWPRSNSREVVLESLTPPALAPIENTLSVQTTTTPKVKLETSYSYLFQNSRETQTSNIVGYLGAGAFGWYVPDWLPTNWTQLEAPLGSEDMIFTPNVRQNPTDFSDITIIVQPSDESYNAGTLYEMEIKRGDRLTLIINEVLLNKHEDDFLKILIDTDTRIYHIVRASGDIIQDTYYIDGKNKTAVITFEARADIFYQFAEKIRDMVEGIGELKQPQG